MYKRKFTSIIINNNQCKAVTAEAMSMKFES